MGGHTVLLSYREWTGPQGRGYSGPPNKPACTTFLCRLPPINTRPPFGGWLLSLFATWAEAEAPPVLLTVVWRVVVLVVSGPLEQETSIKARTENAEPNLITFFIT